MSSFGTMSAGGISGNVWGLQINPEAVFGRNPFSPAPLADGDPDYAANGRLSRALHRARTRTAPRLMAQANQTALQLVLREDVATGRNSLSTSIAETSQDIFGIVMGPSVESLQAGLLAVGDQEVLIAAVDITVDVSVLHAVRIAGVDHDVVGIWPRPQSPNPIAYSLAIKRTA